MLLRLGEFIKKHFALTLLGSLIFTGISFYWISQLKIQTQLIDMFPKSEPQVKMYLDALDNFSGVDLITVVIQGKEKDIKSYINFVHSKFFTVKNVDQVIYKQETEFLKSNGLLLIKAEDLKKMKTMLSASSMKDFIKGINDNFEQVYISNSDSEKLSKNKNQMIYYLNSIEDMLKLLAGNTSKTPEYVAQSFLIGPQYIISPDKSTGLIFIRTPISITDMDNLTPLVNGLQKVLDNTAPQFNVQAGLTGFIVVQRDELVATEKDMSTTSFLSLILILIIFFIGFKLLRYTLLAIIPLIIGIIWALGLTYVVIGSLNLFTAMMGAMLLGLGIDYAIHIISIFTEERQKGTNVKDAINSIFKKAIKGIITGSITTAIGFTMFGISSFKAFSEFGITFGLGIICVLIASILILPPLLLIFGRKNVKSKYDLNFVSVIYEKFIFKHSYVVIGIISILTLLSIFELKNIGFNVNYKELEPAGLESMKLSDLIMEKFDFNTDTTLGITSTLKEARKLAKKADDLASVGAVESITNYIPSRAEQISRMKILQNIQAHTPKNVDQNLYPKKLSQELIRLQNNLIEISDLAYIGAQKKLVKKIDEIINSKIIDKANKYALKNPNISKSLQYKFIKTYKQLILQHNSNFFITQKNLPKSITDAMVGKDGSYLVTIYPKGDLWLNDFQPIFMNDLKTIDTPLTGTSILTLKIMEIAGKEGSKILLLVILVIYIALLFDFRSFKYASLAMLPMILTLILTIGLMNILGRKFDFVNIMALPIIIGIGVDDGVHLIHRYLIERKIMPTIKSTGRAIFLTTCTTIATFGTMIIATYRGFASFGWLLIMGIGFSYLLTIFLLPSLLKITDKINQ